MSETWFQDEAPDQLEAQAEDALDVDLGGLRFEFFHANGLSWWLRLVPGKVNWLGSAWYLEHRDARGQEEQLEDASHAKAVFLDSGLLTPIGRVLRGQGTVDEANAWLKDQGVVQRWAWRLHEAGVQQGVAAMIDHNASPHFLEAMGRTFEESLDWTLDNAEAWGTYDLPPGWKHVYVVQGTDVDQARQCMDAYELMGVLDEVREGRAWLAIGSIAKTKPPALFTRVEAVRRQLGAGHVHVLGVAAKNSLGHMVARGWCQSSDSASVAQQVIGNNGAYHIPDEPGDGVSYPYPLPRQMFFYYAQWAAAARWHDHNLGVGLLERAGKRAAGHDPDQLELIGAG